MIYRNPAGEKPRIHASAYVHPTAVIIGNVCVGKKVFVGPGAVLRADEPGSAIVIGDACNVQDRVIVHALQGSTVQVKESSSLSHGCIVHGPCMIGNRCFVGFGAVVFKAQLGQGVVVQHLAVVEQVSIADGRVVPPLRVVNTSAKVKKLKRTDTTTQQFVASVIAVNQTMLQGYKEKKHC